MRGGVERPCCPAGACLSLQMKVWGFPYENHETENIGMCPFEP